MRTTRTEERRQAAAGKQRVLMSAVSWRRARKKRGSRNEHLGSTRPSAGPRDGDIREQRPDAALDVLGAEGGISTGERKKSSIKNTKAPPDMLTGRSSYVCLRGEVPTDHEEHSKSFGGSAPWRPKRTAKPRQDAAGTAAGVRVCVSQIRRDHDLEADRTPNHDRVQTKALGGGGPRWMVDVSVTNQSGRALGSPTPTHSAWRRRRVVLVSPADHAQHVLRSSA